MAVSFSKWYSRDLLANENDMMVIKVKICDWSVKRVLIDSGSSNKVLYWDAFKGMGIDMSEMLHFKGTLVGFSEEHVQVIWHLAVLTVFGS